MFSPYTASYILFLPFRNNRIFVVTEYIESIPKWNSFFTSFLFVLSPSMGLAFLLFFINWLKLASSITPSMVSSTRGRSSFCSLSSPRFFCLITSYYWFFFFCFNYTVTSRVEVFRTMTVRGCGEAGSKVSFVTLRVGGSLARRQAS